MPNGDIFTPLVYYSCDNCNIVINDMDGFIENEGKQYCDECAFRLQLIDEQYFLNVNGIHLNNCHCAINQDTQKIETWIGGKIPYWERSQKQQRKSKKYQDWRNDIFIRDKYTCQICGQIGEELNAHHIKKYSIYKKLRFKEDNGVTLCIKCHRKKHTNKNANENMTSRILHRDDVNESIPDKEKFMKLINSSGIPTAEFLMYLNVKSIDEISPETINAYVKDFSTVLNGFNSYIDNSNN
ncbi:MAG TPA: HNH endonuclease [Candidatus Nanopelagicaceae bacterium]|nr:HNH endonuclease [Candidatus Nanopelagicaceae bacterium]